MISRLNMSTSVMEILIRAILSRAPDEDREAMMRFIDDQEEPGVGMDNFERQTRRADRQLLDDAQWFVQHPDG